MRAPDDVGGEQATVSERTEDAALDQSATMRASNYQVALAQVMATGKTTTIWAAALEAMQVTGDISVFIRLAPLQTRVFEDSLAELDMIRGSGDVRSIVVELMRTTSYQEMTGVFDREHFRTLFDTKLLRFAAAQIQAPRLRGAPPAAEELVALRDKARELIEAIVREELDPDVTAGLVRLLEEARSALYAYQIRGPIAARESIERILGIALSNVEEYRVAVARTPFAGEALSLVQRVIFYGSVAANAVQLAPASANFLQQMAAGAPLPAGIKAFFGV